MRTAFNYIIVDDDPLSTMISSVILKDALGEVDFKAFTKPREGLAYIRTEVREHTVLFLDINMPTLTGWQFLKQFGLFPEKLKKLVSIYMLSSSLDHRDRDRADANMMSKVL
jgi:two-component SAPR family response regulator